MSFANPSVLMADKNSSIFTPNHLFRLKITGTSKQANEGVVQMNEQANVPVIYASISWSFNPLCIASLHSQVLELIERVSVDAKEITTSVREMPSLKTPMGRCRAWLRLALMQKKLSDYWNFLVDGAILQVNGIGSLCKY